MMVFLLEHLAVLPIVIPMFFGALMILVKDKRRYWIRRFCFFSLALLFASAVSLIFATNGQLATDWQYNIGVYLLGNWDVPYSIVLVADRLSALMIFLTVLLAFCSLLYSSAYWDRVEIHFYPLFQFIIMGLNGAFLTGDLFNLFVFFEIFLASSYGLLLHGSGERRVSYGFHYIVVNLLGAFLMLIGIAMIYSITGTLNIADVAMKAGSLEAGERLLFESACAILGTAFLIKAAAWPLSYWLVGAYSSAAAPVAAMFSIMTKVGIYALLRVGSLLLPTGAPAGFGGEWMYFIGLGTLFYGTVGLFAEKQNARMVAFCIVISSGTLLTALGMPGVALTGPSLYYLSNSVLALGAAFLLVEFVRRTESAEKSVLSVSLEAFGLDKDDTSDYSGAVIGVAIPASMAFLGLAFFTCILIVAGLPPFSGFIAKFALLSQAISLTQHEMGETSVNAWLLVVFMLLSGLATVIAMSRTGIRLFWGSGVLQTPTLTYREVVPVSLLLGACITMSIFASDVMGFMNATALSLNDPTEYIRAVFAQDPIGVRP